MPDANNKNGRRFAHIPGHGVRLPSVICDKRDVDRRHPFLEPVRTDASAIRRGQPAASSPFGIGGV
ncbi:hypothetical protein [Pseudomonas cavernae]|uniref:hypothetical protein n=1 Tax=Pseudomonas cavernae TaxID=2320867 RepID=UPI0013C5158B|nr:hypothetical protein [Pseudomonas cavernae]